MKTETIVLSTIDNGKTDLDYLYIRAWEKMMGSYLYYRDIQIAKARDEMAPQDAIYKDSDGSWKTAKDITNQKSKERVEKIADEIRRNNLVNRAFS